MNFLRQMAGSGRNPAVLLDFKKLLTARFLFSFAVQIQAVVLGWRMYDLTQDPLYLGFVGLAEAVPALSLALYAGYIVDRSRPLIVYRWVLTVSLLSGALLFFSQHSALNLSHDEQVVALFASSFLTGLARSFSQPSIYATVPRLVPRDFLRIASAWSTTSMQMARISGPAVGGILFGWLGVSPAGAVVCGALLLALLIETRIKASIPPPETQNPNRSVQEELFSGARFVFKHPILLPALSLDMISVFFGGVTALLPIFASEILLVGPKGLGALRAAPAIGAMILGLGLTRIDIRARAGTWLLWAVTGFGLSIVVFGLSKSFVISLIALGLSGAFDSISMVVRGLAVQLASPDSMRGKISSVNAIFIGSSNELGEFESGVLAKFFGTVPTVLFGGAICLLTVGTITALSPTLRKLDLRKLA